MKTSKTQPHAFMIVCSEQGPLTLACSTQESLKEWVSALNKVSTKDLSAGFLETWPQENGSCSGDSAETTPELARRCNTLSRSSNVQDCTVSDAAIASGQGRTAVALVLITGK